MNNFNNKGRFGGGGGGFKRGGSGGFAPRQEMHQAVCAGCGKTCEVPFRPNGKKPVYCNDCFAKNNGEAPRENSRDTFPKKTFNNPVAPRAEATPQIDFKKIDELKKQLEFMNSKFDRLISVLEAFLSKEETKAKKASAKKK